jgi:heptosyltransferase-2
MAPKPQALILMTGQSGLRPRLSAEGRLADVLRTTCLLHLYKGHRVTWIVSPHAAGLLEANHLIDELLVAEVPADAAALAGHRWETLINLERGIGWTQWASEQDAGQRFGYVLEGGQPALAPASRVLLPGEQPTEAIRPLQQILYEIVGQTWMGQPYVLGCRPSGEPTYDVGLCLRRGEAWPTIAWSRNRWRQLEGRLTDELRVSEEPESGGLSVLIQWLGTCALLVCHDGLALHLALALGKRVVALFGPTPPEQVYLYGQGVKLSAPVLRDCSPCRSPRCLWGQSCMDHIDPAVVARHVMQLMPTSVVGASQGSLR